MSISFGWDSDAFKHPVFDVFHHRRGISGFYISLLGFETQGFFIHKQRKAA